ncbi:copper amine oxidase N-terminal domain-containing protein [Bacillus massilinigeriensis]|uniref:copper amine oxidase N-terminal domain-containing protein n=1 Tax=Bacillus massilionigeriensis TaxID=1805475 RepID=UPI00096B2C7F|nr:copper amine oxidase N-terminal domain-containing protein [Bacillus massilionigeriensis]
MKKFSKWLMIPLTIALVVGLFSSIVNADDDDHEKYGEYGEYEKHEKSHDGFILDDDEEYEHERHGEYDDDDEYDKHDDEGYEKDGYKDGGFRGNQSTISQSSFWNIWTREAVTSINNDLPFQNAQEVEIELNQQTEKLFMLPQNGQLLISSEQLGKFIGAKTTFYQQSKILVISKGKKELIVRAGTNAVYEDMVKTPIPTKSLYYENSIFVPISVIANAFDYRVNWDAQKEIMTLQSIN